MKNLFLFTFIFLTGSVFGQGQLQNEASGMLKYTSDKVMQLLDVVPEDKLSWTPSDGVRTFGSIFAHIISTNYFFASKLGADMPSNAKMDMEHMEMVYETKADLKMGLQDSYSVILTAIAGTEDGSMSDAVEYPFPGEYTNMSTVLIALSHSNEHLGQLIGYSRMTGITPPWSMEK